MGSTAVPTHCTCHEGEGRRYTLKFLPEYLSSFSFSKLFLDMLPGILFLMSFRIVLTTDSLSNFGSPTQIRTLKNRCKFSRSRALQNTGSVCWRRSLFSPLRAGSWPHLCTQCTPQQGLELLLGWGRVCSPPHQFGLGPGGSPFPLDVQGL